MSARLLLYGRTVITSWILLCVQHTSLPASCTLVELGSGFEFVKNTKKQKRQQHRFEFDLPTRSDSTTQASAIWTEGSVSIATTGEDMMRFDATSKCNAEPDLSVVPVEM